MPEQNDTDNDSSKANKEDDSTSHAGLRWILIAGCTLFIALLFLSVFLPNLTERVKFFTVNALSLLVLLAIAVQVFINRRQWEAMQGQLDLMQTQTATMQGQLDVMREAQVSFAIGERAYLTIEDVAFIAKGQNPRVVFTLFNGGRTPAFDVTSETEAAIGAEPPTGKIESLGHPRGEKIYMPAGTRKQSEMVFPTFTMTAARWKAVEAGTATFFLRGVFYYKDFQNIQRALPFCIGYDPSLNRFREYKTESDSENQN